MVNKGIDSTLRAPQDMLDRGIGAGREAIKKIGGPFTLTGDKFNIPDLSSQLQSLASGIQGLGSMAGGAVNSAIKGPPSINDIPLDEDLMNLMNMGKV